ncbi:lanthionine synthetase LanC family protein [Brevibacillus halotolerans]|uniref:lanthionine synthetase LanC family protein n=1 Tax=Brevibacillus halotolerans TaxID=1507437 RepID=UPI0015EE90BA|nr:lanthionine synthetase LanC family protein [Brevibacillus halotolerans]MBA4535187.1 protein kinase [Brevibacillus halotolerans]
MSYQDAFILPEDVVLIPVRDMPKHILEQVEFEETDYVISRVSSRKTSSIIDAEFADLICEFKTAKTIVQAIIRFSKEKKLDPEQTLENAFPMIQRFIHADILVPKNSEKSKIITSSFEPGDRIAEYQVVQCISYTEDTELYQVKDVNGHLAALKIARPERNEEMKILLAREAAILKHLDGQHVPKLLGTGTFQNTDYLALEWFDGENLRNLPEGKSYKTRFHLCRNILEAYAHTHANGIIHGDIHEGNILVDGDANVKIIDFGISLMKRKDSDLKEVPRGGFSFYFEPEFAEFYLAQQLAPRANYLTDQYSLAALLYYILTGSYYLNFSYDKKKLFRQIAKDDPLPFSNHGIEWPEVENVLRKALSKKPSQRFPSVSEFLKSFIQITTEPVIKQVQPQEIIEPVDLSDANRLLDDVLDRMGHLSSPLLSEEFPTAPTCSVNYGMAGIAYGLYRVAMNRKDAELFSVADVWLSKAIAQTEAKATGAFINEQLQLTAENVGHISPYHTASGVYLVQALISRTRGDYFEQQSAIENFVTVTNAPCDNLDLTLGKSSVLLAYSILLDSIIENELTDKNSLLPLGNELMTSIWDHLNMLPTIKECRVLPLLGIAHGWGGLLYAAIRWCESSSFPIPSHIVERLYQLAELGDVKRNGIGWRREYSKYMQPDYLPGWCNGSAGMVFLWTLAHQILKDEKFLILAEKTAWNVWREPELSGNLCCGLAGQAYGMLHLYKYTGDTNWLYRSQEFAKRASANIKLTPRNILNSLYKGELGVAVLLSDLTNPEFSCFPLFERESF